MSARVPPTPAPACRECGCTDELACVVRVDGELRGCRWVDIDADAGPAGGPLCSACSKDEFLVRRGPARIGGVLH